MNPELRVMMTKDANSLDSDNMKLLSEMATKNDYQLWVERVQEDQLPAIIIEDGAIKDSSFVGDKTNNKKEKKK